MFSSGHRSPTRGRSDHSLFLIVVVGVLFAPSVARVQESFDFTVPDLDANAILMAEVVEAEVTFVDPFGIGGVSDLTISATEQIAASSRTLTVSPDSVGGGDKSATRTAKDDPQIPAELTIRAAPYQPITITVDEVVDGAGYSLSDFRCNYNAGPDTPCDGSGFTETSVSYGTLLVGATLTGDGTRVAGGADGRFEVTISYQ